MKRRRVTLDGHRWTVRWVTRLGKAPQAPAFNKAGDCDTARREIRVVSGADPHEERRVLIHEMLHATCPWMDEEQVDRASDEINDALTRCGYPPMRGDAARSRG